MGLHHFQDCVTDVDHLRELIGQPSELVLRKELRDLDRHMVDFLGRAPFALVATYGADGRCDISPRGDRPSVVHVVDSTALVMADRPGNRRVDTLSNIVETGQIGLLFMIPGIGETLRVNGKATITRDTERLAPFGQDGKPAPVLGIGISVEECYLQCAKAIIRSKIWEAEGGTQSLPGFADILIEQCGIDDETAESLTERIETAYRDNLF